MLKLRALFAGALVASLMACGGGGGSAGTPSSGTGSGSALQKGPTLSITLTDSSGAPSSSITGNGIASANAKLLDANGTPVANTKVTFAAEEGLVKLTPAGTALTNAAGVATVQLAAASLTSAGAGTLSATATVNGQSAAASRDFQVAAVNLTLTSFNLGTTPLPAFGNRPISVVATVDGKTATNAPVQVTFNVSCGTVEPAAVSTDATGTASTTYSASDSKCSGSNVSISASTTGGAAVSGSLAVLPAAATNVQFVAADPSLIYLSGTAGATQSQVSFKVVDATGGPLQNQTLQLSLVNSGPGISLGTVGNAAPITLSTNAAGLVTVPVFSGTVPTSAQVRAVATGNPALFSVSNTLTVASGRPVQKAMSLALEKLSIEGLRTDGVTTAVTVSLADRQGNPVPDGTEVNFVAQAGVLIPARCVVANGTSQCAVTIRSQGTRPESGQVKILAYVPGEEDFIDANFNNIYDFGEAFSDLGNAYRDDNDNDQYDLGEFTVPRAGTVACPGGIIGRPNTCDGQWGVVDVRRETTIVFASSTGRFSQAVTSPAAITVLVGDVNGNSMPTGSAISAEKISGEECTIKKVSPNVVPNQIGPVLVTVLLDSDKCKAGDVIGVTVETPGGNGLGKSATTQPIVIQ